ncbi:hypothetical protein RN001_015547 [Aquatica leii]|uniref:Uncharacterized protein n=1 Tax=Aquatica leii TaxID=1421715 RepID=A0AAN7P1Y7_9COLE|nr:hypothetical protein RN001_015547 [Aquatica leii]
MMMFVLLTLLLSSLVACQVHDHNVLYGPYLSQCICATAVKVQFAYDWFKYDKFVDDACFKCFLKCVTVGVGIYGTDGTLRRNVMIKLLGIPVELLDNCTTRFDKETDTCVKIYKFGLCIHKLN